MKGRLGVERVFLNQTWMKPNPFKFIAPFIIAGRHASHFGY